MSTHELIWNILIETCDLAGSAVDTNDKKEWTDK